MSGLDPGRYIQLLREDGELMATLAPRGLDRSVPPCPGWDVAEVMRHTGSVYGHKIASIRLAREPQEGDWQQQRARDEDLVTWFRAAHAALIDELLARGPQATSYTWWPPDQTVGFWYRRMALETAVHRADVESAFGEPGPVDAELATDGVDEILRIMLADEDADKPDDNALGTVGVHCGGAAWTVQLEPSRSVASSTAAPESTDADVTGESSAVFLYLWGRLPATAVSRSGDLTLADALRRRLAAATQ